MDPEILYECKEANGAAWAEITLNRPDKGNALTMPMLERLSAIAEALAADRKVRAVVLRAQGRFFCTGGDIAAWGSLTPAEMAQAWILRGIEVFEQVASLPQPVIAVLQGHALGGGLELALAADLRIAVRTAKFGTPEVTLGMISGWMGVRRLAETIGPARARHLTLLGTPIAAAQALDWGLITAMAEDSDGVEQQTNAWVTRLCGNGPIAMALTKGILATVHEDLRHHHAAAVAQAAASEDCREGVRSFLEKRAPVYRNR